jgi:hypothetical protein
MRHWDVFREAGFRAIFLKKVCCLNGGVGSEAQFVEGIEAGRRDLRLKIKPVCFSIKWDSHIVIGHLGL